MVLNIDTNIISYTHTHTHTYIYIYIYILYPTYVRIACRIHHNGKSSLWYVSNMSPDFLFGHTLTHALQFYGFSPLWKRICLLRFCLLKTLYRIFHTDIVLSSVLLQICPFNWSFRENCLLHTLQWYGFSPVWMSKCLFTLAFSENCLLHILQW